MKFRTEIDIKPSGLQIGYQSKTMFIGSCFTENIGKQFAKLRLPALVNPFGVVYNPISVKNSIEFILAEKQFKTNELFQANEQWNNFYFHSSYSQSTPHDSLRAMNESVQNAATFIKQCNYLYITFGTSFCFEHIESSITVSNNHKLPAKAFRRYRLSVGEIVSNYKTLLQALLKANPRLQIIFTVSPIRHLKDGAHGNQLSKATLLLAIDQLCEMFDFCSYFPSYEIFMDDLRDYRFYNNDLVHPSDTAIEYVWEKFSENYIEPKSLDLAKRIEKLHRAMGHRVSKPKSESHQKFVAYNISEVKKIQDEFPFVELEDARLYFEQSRLMD